MLWQLLRGLEGRYAPCSGYDAEGMLEEDTSSPADLPLDPICVAGQLKIFDVRNAVAGLQFAERAVDIVTRLDVFMEEVHPPISKRRRPLTDEKWLRHITELQCTTPKPILVPIKLSEVKWTASYFAVLKTTDEARAIYNGKRFSLQCRTPPQTNLPDITVLLGALCDLVEDSGGAITVCEGDIRHFFHQIPLDEMISQFFCINIAEDDVLAFFRWSTLPMGWSFSPFIAQSISMGILIRSLALCGLNMDRYKDLSTPPPFIIHRVNGKIVLVAAVWYDNILVASSDANLAMRIHQKFQTQCNTVNLELKRWDIFSPSKIRMDGFSAGVCRHNRDDPNDSPICSECIRPSYLNLEFATRLVRREETSAQAMFWRHSKKFEKKIAELLHILENSSGLETCRFWARVVGTLLWDAHISMSPLCKHETLIGLAQKIGVAAAADDWDSPYQCTLEEVAELARLTKEVSRNQWRTDERRRMTTQCINIATDSSKRRWGSIVWRSGEEPLTPVVSRPWDDKMLLANIFIKELTAAVISIEDACSIFTLTRIRLLCDNTAAVAVMRKLCSSTRAGNELARRIVNALERSGCTLDVVHITTLFNPADEPSRGRVVVQSKIAFAEELIASHDEGIKIELKHRVCTHRSTIGLRHEENDEANIVDNLADDESEIDEDVELQREYDLLGLCCEY